MNKLLVTILSLILFISCEKDEKTVEIIRNTYNPPISVKIADNATFAEDTSVTVSLDINLDNITDFMLQTDIIKDNCQYAPANSNYKRVTLFCTDTLFKFLCNGNSSFMHSRMVFLQQSDTINNKTEEKYSSNWLMTQESFIDFGVCHARMIYCDTGSYYIPIVKQLNNDNFYGWIHISIHQQFRIFMGYIEVRVYESALSAIPNKEIIIE